MKKDKTKKKDKFKILECTPNKKTKRINNSCYEDKILFKMKNIWNRYNSDKIITNEPRKIWYFLKNKFKKSCDDELCWLKYKNFKKYFNFEEIQNNFRPIAPEKWKNNFYEWLSSLDIIKVMKQYEKNFTNFVFIGPSSIDFDDKEQFGICVFEKLCKFDLKKYYDNKKTKIGIILNLDYHYNRGTHWVSLFIDLDKNFIFYFDSNGVKIPKRVNILINRILEQGHLIQKNFKVLSNEGNPHQNKDGSCGMYAMYVIIQLLQELQEPYFYINNKVSDEDVQKCRKKYYNFK